MNEFNQATQAQILTAFKEEIESLRQQLILKEHQYDVMKASAEVLAEQCDKMRQQLSAAQAKIDELMMEYCPEEMTNEQIAEYEKHQRPAWRNFSLELKKEQK